MCSIAVCTSWDLGVWYVMCSSPAFAGLEVISLNNNRNCILNPVHMMQKHVLSAKCCGLIGTVLLSTLIKLLH